MLIVYLSKQKYCNLKKTLFSPVLYLVPPTAMSSSTDDEELNLESAKFNPLKALYSQKLKLPAVQQNFENLGIFEARLKAAGNEPEADLASFKHHKSKKTDAGTSKQRDSEPINDDKFHTTKSGRVFDKSQGE